MSDGETKLIDTSGDYLYAVRNGEPVASPTWRSCRLVLTNERLIIATSDGKQAIAHGNIELPDEPEAVVPESVSAGDATPLRIGDSVILVDPSSVSDFESEYCRAVLHDAVILAKPEAVVGGVVRDDAAWSKARFRFDDDRIVLGLPGGDTVEFDVDDVGTIEERTETVREAERPVLTVEHTDADDRAVETHFSGTAQHVAALTDLLNMVISGREEDVELSETEQQVIMALYSGVSPFEMAEFVGIDVGEVEEIYHKLLEVGAVDKVRERTEVSLNAQGRNLASEAMSEQ